MTEQDPQRPRVVLGAFSRGGEEKTVSDLDSQRSAEDWAPVIIDTPGSYGPLLPAQDDSLPPLPLPGLLYPDLALDSR